MSRDGFFLSGPGLGAMVPKPEIGWLIMIVQESNREGLMALVQSQGVDVAQEHSEFLPEGEQKLWIGPIRWEQAGALAQFALAHRWAPAQAVRAEVEPWATP